ncbi:MAG: DUF2152 domain-containing protein [Desulfobacteraceae bacterium]|nr:DUF2152 domain-containing protein [Desulfobacteraceae bacterium]
MFVYSSSATRQKFPVKQTEPVTAILYITSDKAHMDDLKHTIHVKEVAEGARPPSPPLSLCLSSVPLSMVWVCQRRRSSSTCWRCTSTATTWRVCRRASGSCWRC